MKIDVKEFFQKEFNKIVFAEATSDATYKKIVVKRLIGANKKYQAERFTDKQAFHVNFDDIISYVEENLSFYRSVYAWGDESYSLTVRNGVIVSAKKIEGEAKAVTHNREKVYPINEGDDAPVFIELGIFTKERKVVRSMYDKFKQINRYLEMLADVLQDFKAGDDIYVIDYCSGKSYLSFAVYYYLTKQRGLKVTLDGIDLKADVMEKCARLAKEYGYDGMNFYALDIKDFEPKKTPDLVISLHACDIATDYALYSAVKAGAQRIFAAPCCHHECAKTISYNYEPLLSSYGILTERVSALITDAVRCALLEINGYKTDLMEFVDITDSPKNLLIRAVKAPRPASLIKLKKAELASIIDRTDAHFTAVDLLLPKE